jgi:PAS domain S-box-containing protein
LPDRRFTRTARVPVPFPAYPAADPAAHAASTMTDTHGDAAGAPHFGDGEAREALDALDAGLAVVTPDWRIVYANAAWSGALGVDDGVVGRTLWEAFPGFADMPQAELVRATMVDGAPRDYRIVYANAAVRGTFDVRVRRTAAGALVVRVRNATVQARREQVQDRLLESIGEGLFVVDEGWRVTYFNAAAERISGTPRDTVLGRPLWERFPTLLGSRVEQLCRDTMQRREPQAATAVPLARVVGGRAAGRFDARTYPVEGGGVLVLFAEVSDRERQARELAERSAENESLRDLARAMAAVLDSSALLATLCEAARRLCKAAGATVAELDGDESGAFVAAVGHEPAIHGRRFPLAGSLTERLLAERGQGSGCHTVTRSAATPDGDPPYYPRLADGRPIGPLLLAPLVAHGEVLGVLAVSRATGERPFSGRDAQRLCVIADHASLALWKARLFEEAQQANLTKSNFLTTISHELRTPLTALTGYGELLADEILGPLAPPQHDVVERMRSVTHQLTTMIEEVLTFSALEAGRERVRPARVTPADVVRGAAAVVEPLAQQKGLGFVTEVAGDAPPLFTDPDKLRQILVNLAGNGVKFTERGEVRVRAEAHAAGMVRFVVRDTGVGIADADLPRLFQPFSQVHTGLTRRFGGTGLGLYISQRLAGLLGGYIEVDSAPGVGSTFTLVVPQRIGG